jgi:hypothetical protein
MIGLEGSDVDRVDRFGGSDETLGASLKPHEGRDT